MASSVATPLERQFGHIAGVTEMTSSELAGQHQRHPAVRPEPQHRRRRARDVEAGINAARTYLPANLPSNPSYRKVNPADSPIMIIGLTSDKYDKETMYDAASTIMEQKLSQIQGVGPGERGRRFVSLGAGRRQPAAVEPLRHYPGHQVSALLSLQNSDVARGQITNGVGHRRHRHQRPDLQSRRIQVRWWSATTMGWPCTFPTSPMCRTRRRAFAPAAT